MISCYLAPAPKSNIILGISVLLTDVTHNLIALICMRSDENSYGDAERHKLHSHAEHGNEVWVVYLLRAKQLSFCSPHATQWNTGIRCIDYPVFRRLHTGYGIINHHKMDLYLLLGLGHLGIKFGRHFDGAAPEQLQCLSRLRFEYQYRH